MLAAIVSVLGQERARKRARMGRFLNLCLSLRMQLLLVGRSPASLRDDPLLLGYLHGVVTSASSWSDTTWMHADYVILEGYDELFGDREAAIEALTRSASLQADPVFALAREIGHTEFTRAEKIGASLSQMAQWLVDPESRPCR